MKRYAQAAAEVSAPDARPDGACVAYGCPLPATMSNSALGGSDACCTFHHGAAYADFANITTAVRNRLPLIRIALRLCTAPPGYPLPTGLRREILAAGGEELLAVPEGAKPRSARAQGISMVRSLDRECRGHAPILDQKMKAAGETWAHAGQQAAVSLADKMAPKHP
jgi:hypothetical protein